MAKRWESPTNYLREKYGEAPPEKGAAKPQASGAELAPPPETPPAPGTRATSELGWQSPSSALPTKRHAGSSATWAGPQWTDINAPKAAPEVDRAVSSLPPWEEWKTYPLGADEPLRWVGRPGFWATTLRRLKFSVLPFPTFGLAVAGVLVFVATLNPQSAWHFLLVHLGVAIGILWYGIPTLFVASRVTRLSYAITDRRILVLRDKKLLNSIPLSERYSNYVGVQIHTDGSGSVQLHTSVEKTDTDIWIYRKTFGSGLWGISDVAGAIAALNVAGKVLGSHKPKMPESDLSEMQGFHTVIQEPDETILWVGRSEPWHRITHFLRTAVLGVAALVIGVILFRTGETGFSALLLPLLCWFLSACLLFQVWWRVQDVRNTAYFVTNRRGIAYRETARGVRILTFYRGVLEGARKGLKITETNSRPSVALPLLRRRATGSYEREAREFVLSVWTAPTWEEAKAACTALDGLLTQTGGSLYR